MINKTIYKNAIIGNENGGVERWVLYNIPYSPLNKRWNKGLSTVEVILIIIQVNKG